MSLDVNLWDEKEVTAGFGIFVRAEGEMREITREEWDKAFPGQEPVIFKQEEDYKGPVFSANITHNLGKMAEAAGIYKHLWRPEELEEIKKAKDLIAPLTKGLDILRATPVLFQAFNPANGWGTYEGLIGFVERYLEACKEFPEATISASR